MYIPQWLFNVSCGDVLEIVIGVKVDYFGGYVNNDYDGRRGRARAYEYASTLTLQLSQTKHL